MVAALVAFLAIGIAAFFLTPLGFFGTSVSGGAGAPDPADPVALPAGANPVTAAQNDGFVRAFEVRYQVNDAAAFQSLPSDVDRDQVRAGISAPVDNAVTYRTQFHVFSTRPTISDLTEYIDQNILGPNLAVQQGSALQEHVWRQGAWVCETRFTIADASSGDPITTSVTVQGTTFNSAGFWISAYEYH